MSLRCMHPTNYELTLWRVVNSSKRRDRMTWRYALVLAILGALSLLPFCLMRPGSIIGLWYILNFGYLQILVWIAFPLWLIYGVFVLRSERLNRERDSANKPNSTIDI